MDAGSGGWVDLEEFLIFVGFGWIIGVTFNFILYIISYWKKLKVISSVIKPVMLWIFGRGLFSVP